ncbi:ABC transporter ATP-binding protein [Desulfoplanes sp. PS50]
MNTQPTTVRPLLNMQSIRKSYNIGQTAVEILKGIDLIIRPGELISIVGTSGCGKSTLMNIMGFLDTATSGTIAFEGRDVSNLTDNELSAIRNNKIGFVFQHFFLLPKLTALDNVSLPLVYRGVSPKKRRAVAEEMLARVNMSDRGHHRPSELSGGQQQRVAIARALAGTPSLILADEPTGALDTATSREIMELFKDLNAREGITLVLITHDPAVAGQCTRPIRISDGLLSEAG